MSLRLAPALSQLGHGFRSRAAQVAELSRMHPEGLVPSGWFRLMGLRYVFTTMSMSLEVDNLVRKTTTTA